MASSTLETIKQMLAACTPEERMLVFRELRSSIQIHELEVVFGAPAETILEAIHRAPELTRRMLRGVIADAAFAQQVVPRLVERGWRDVMPEGNFSFDHLLEDDIGRVSVQVKLQRSEKGSPVITSGTKSGLAAGMYMVEPQRTRGGKRRGAASDEADAEARKTRPYRYGEFDLIAVSLQPSTGDWSCFRYTVGNWLLPGNGPNEIATYQPVAMEPNEDWTDDFEEAAARLRSGVQKRIGNGQGAVVRRTRRNARR